MNHKWRNFFYVLLLLSTVFSQTASVYAEAEREEPAVSAPEYVLMEAETGTVIAQKEKDVRRSPASVTKIMTLLLIFDQLEPAVSAPEYVLMEAETGTVIAQKEKDVRRSPASVTKIMTLLLIFDQLENGSLKMEDKVITSAYAKSMGGSSWKTAA